MEGLEIKIIKREFLFDGKTLADPNPNFTIDRVKGFYSNMYPTIINTVVAEEQKLDGKIVYNLKKNPGTHG